MIAEYTETIEDSKIVIEDESHGGLYSLKDDSASEEL